jgi:hypothetical protein
LLCLFFFAFAAPSFPPRPQLLQKRHRAKDTPAYGPRAAGDCAIDARSATRGVSEMRIRPDA